MLMEGELTACRWKVRDTRKRLINKREGKEGKEGEGERGGEGEGNTVLVLKSLHNIPLILVLWIGLLVCIVIRPRPHITRTQRTSSTFVGGRGGGRGRTEEVGEDGGVIFLGRGRSGEAVVWRGETRFEFINR